MKKIVAILGFLSLFVQHAGAQAPDGLHVLLRNQVTVDEAGRERSYNDYYYLLNFVGDPTYDPERGIIVYKAEISYLYVPGATAEVTESPDGIFREFKITIKIPTYHPQLYTMVTGYELFDITIRLGEEDILGSYIGKKVESGELIGTMSGDAASYAYYKYSGGKG